LAALLEMAIEREESDDGHAAAKNMLNMLP
jgi:hypothetical protein